MTVGGMGFIPERLLMMMMMMVMISFFSGIYSCTGIFNNCWKKMGEYEITGLGKKVVWVFPKRNGKIIGWAGWHSHEWWSGDWWTGGLVDWRLGGAHLVSQHILPGTRQNPDENPNQL